MVKVPFGCFGDVWVDVSKIPKISAWNLGHLKVPRLLALLAPGSFPFATAAVTRHGWMARSRSSSKNVARFGGVDHERGAYGLKVR